MTEFINKNGKNNSELDEIFAIKDKNIMVYNLCRYLEKKSSEGKRLSALSAAERVIYIVNEFKTEAVTGCGFYDFFYEREDAHIDEAAACLRVVGANKMADICEKRLLQQVKPYIRVSRNRLRILLKLYGAMMTRFEIATKI